MYTCNVKFVIDERLYQHVPYSKYTGYQCPVGDLGHLVKVDVDAITIIKPASTPNKPEKYIPVKSGRPAT